jgi:hypothetical protein
MIENDRINFFGDKDDGNAFDDYLVDVVFQAIRVNCHLHDTPENYRESVEKISAEVFPHVEEIKSCMSYDLSKKAEQLSDDEYYKACIKFTDNVLKQCISLVNKICIDYFSIDSDERVH